jgi:TolA-binding protein
MSIDKKQWIGWALTILLAVIAAVASSSGRIATTENSVANCEKRIDKKESIDREQYEKINEKLDKLIIEVTELRIEIKHKQDK